MSLMSQTSFDALLGKTIVGLESGTYEVPGDDDPLDYLRFLTSDGGYVAYAAEGDCCSRSWFNHLSGLDALLGQTVIAVQVKPMSEIPGTGDGWESDELKIYGWTLTTPRGYVDLEMRNSSNGYYGGSIERLDSDREIVWKRVDADF